MAETPAAHTQVNRLITRYDIAARRPHPHIFGEPADMRLAEAGSVEPGDVEGLALPYCIDLAARRALYTVTAREDLDALFGAPFLYAAQLRLARAALGVPFARLADMNPADGLHPVLVFSPGRAGSTLLARMLSGIGRLSASEPDLLTQLATLSPDMRAALPPGTEAALSTPPSRPSRAIAGATWSSSCAASATRARPGSWRRFRTPARCSCSAAAPSGPSRATAASPPRSRH